MPRLFRNPLLAAALALACGASHGAASLFAFDDTWVDEQGRSLRLAQWRGRPTVVAMEYSACRFVCSVAWRRLVQLQQEADRRGLALEFVVLSIDPDNDSPAAWQDYRRARGLARDNWHFLTAGRGATTRAAGLLGVRWWYADGHLMHDFRIVRLDAEGVVAAAVGTYDEPLDKLLSAR
ncbi:MAG: SCO family protein [Rubrivivax sp.]